MGVWRACGSLGCDRVHLQWAVGACNKKKWHLLTLNTVLMYHFHTVCCCCFVEQIISKTLQNSEGRGLELIFYLTNNGK